jgi:hypothetical protein
MNIVSFLQPYTMRTRKAELNCSLLRMGIKKMSPMRLHHTKPPLIDSMDTFGVIGRKR